MNQVNWARRKNVWASRKIYNAEVCQPYWVEAISISESSQRRDTSVEVGPGGPLAKKWLCIKLTVQKARFRISLSPRDLYHSSSPSLSPIHATITIFRIKEFIFLTSAVVICCTLQHANYIFHLLKLGILRMTLPYQWSVYYADCLLSKKIRSLQ